VSLTTISAYEICERNKPKCLLSSKYYWHVRKIMRPGKCDEGRPRGRGWFTLGCSIEVVVKGITCSVMERIQDYGNKPMKQWIVYRRGI
jgi:hypothetical protein